MLAGIYDPGADRGESKARLTRAFGDESRVVQAGPLAVAGGFDGTDADETAGCVVDGTIFDLDGLARALQLPSAREPNALLAAAYRREGERMLDRLRGAFSLVAWADGGERILIAPDQVAARTVFVHRSGDSVVFASELRDLLALLPQRPAPDPLSLLRGIAIDWPLGFSTHYAGVERVGPGRCIAIDRGRIDTRRYWAPEYRQPLDGSRLEVAARLREGVLAALAARTAGVDRVGLMLSGGFDSGTVAAAASAVRQPDQSPIRGYSAVFPDQPKEDESAELDVLTRRLGLASTRFHVQPGGVLRLCLTYPREWATPLPGPSHALEHGLMRRAADDGVSVMLDGQGGDETFGSSPYLLADWLRQGRIMSALVLARRRFPGSQKASRKAIVELLKSFGVKPALPYRVARGLRELRSRGQERGPGWLTPENAMTVFRSQDDLAWLRDGGGPRWWRWLSYILVDARPGLGDYCRQRAASVGIEALPPLYDLDLIELVLQIPPDYGFDPWLDRALAREAVAGLLPDEIRLARRKSNLAAFPYESLAGHDLDAIRRILGPGAEVNAYIRRDVLQGMLDRPPGVQGPDWHQWIAAVFGCLSMECFLRSQEDPGFAQRTIEQEGLKEPTYADLSA